MRFHARVDCMIEIFGGRERNKQGVNELLALRTFAAEASCNAVPGRLRSGGGILPDDIHE